MPTQDDAATEAARQQIAQLDEELQQVRGELAVARTAQAENAEEARAIREENARLQEQLRAMQDAAEGAAQQGQALAARQQELAAAQADRDRLSAQVKEL